MNSINIQAAFLVSFIAMFTTTLVVIIAAKLSQKQEKEKYMAEIKKYSELSKDASHVGARGIYAAFQKQGNETMINYFVSIYKEAVLELALHVLTMGLLQRYYPVEIVHFPFKLWPFGNGLGSISWYIITAIAFFYAVIAPNRPKIRFFRPEWR